MIIDNWEFLSWWDCGEYQVTEERLDDLDVSGQTYCPGSSNVYRALDCTPFSEVKVAFIAQDPYPNPKFATGLALSIPASLRKYPPSLDIVYQELQSDLRITRKNGSLEGWAEQGVLLWNSIPTCLAFKSLSHDWTEWEYLTKEIVERLSVKGIVFVFIGSRARNYAKFVTPENNVVIEVGHPSPRGNHSARIPFTGCRLFSTVNDALGRLALGTIDWSK